MRIGKGYNHSKYITTLDINQLYKLNLVYVNSMIYVLRSNITNKLTITFMPLIHSFIRILIMSSKYR